MPEDNLLIQTNALVKIYGSELRALDGIDLAIREGEFVAVMGPSGSGKSTLLNLLGALDRPTSGEVIIDGERISQLRDQDLYRSQTVGFVFQLHNLLPTLNTLENVQIPLYETNLTRRERQRRAIQLLDDIGLASKAKHLPAQLSGGERQRVAIARALANEPRLLLADEPTGNLDSVRGGEIMALLRRLNREQGVTILVVTHDRDVARKTDRILVLHDGKIIRDDPVRDIYREDLLEFKASKLGRTLQEGVIPPEIEALGLDEALPCLQGVFARL